MRPGKHITTRQTIELSMRLKEVTKVVREDPDISRQYVEYLGEFSDATLAAEFRVSKSAVANIRKLSCGRLMSISDQPKSSGSLLARVEELERLVAGLSAEMKNRPAP